MLIFITLSASSGKRNGVRPSVCLSRLFLTLIERAAHVHQGAACDAASEHFGTPTRPPSGAIINDLV